MDTRAGGKSDVATTPRDDYIRAHVQQFQERIYACDRNNACRLLDLIFSQVGKAPEPGEHLAVAQFFLQICLWHFGIEITDLEFRQLVLACQILNDADELVHPTIAAGVAGRADHQWYAVAAGCCEKQFQLLAHEMAQRGVFAEVDRTGVGTTAVSYEVVGFRRHAKVETLRIGRRGTQVTGRNQHPQFPFLAAGSCHRVLQVGDLNGRAAKPSALIFNEIFLPLGQGVRALQCGERLCFVGHAQRVHQGIDQHQGRAVKRHK